MAGLVPAIHVLQTSRMAGGYVYILTNRPNDILYVGVTYDLLKRLVYFEQFDDIRDAIQREHNIKHWPRAWNFQKIVAMNPDWNDLYDEITK
ncbi:GIY-YIG nuclease family protein [Bradyrhizobium sp.]|uniref:GIY-YIG nuclease family protein n=1 Tax=Bradyrhizobium sp. TaxID=376 RepID=UPI001D6BFE24|nr:GIY-YIG nuclease family protein [Bradyrhizobium sp.]MBI5322300.1 GIY-YIG nuclease family protein [Bradyrhizobium sp.]